MCFTCEFHGVERPLTPRARAAVSRHRRTVQGTSCEPEPNKITTSEHENHGATSEKKTSWSHYKPKSWNDSIEQSIIPIEDRFIDEDGNADFFFPETPNYS